jgi:enoyl-CoA hydratase/carnithine racemase
VNSPSDSLIALRLDGGVATLTLNRPERHNSLVPALLNDFLAALDDAEENAQVLVIRANGESFSTGGDLRGFLDHEDDIAAYANELVGLLNDAIIRLYDSQLPSIVVVEGQVTGGSLGLVLASDIVLITEAASFTPYYVNVGFAPDGGWATLLPDVIGAKRAGAVQLLNQTISAEQALDWGLATAYAGSNKIEAAVVELAEDLLQKQSASIRSTRAHLRPDRLEVRLEQERREFVRQIATENAIRGIKDFIGVK